MDRRHKFWVLLVIFCFLLCCNVTLAKGQELAQAEVKSSDKVVETGKEIKGDGQGQGGIKNDGQGQGGIKEDGPGQGKGNIKKDGQGHSPAQEAPPAKPKLKIPKIYIPSGLSKEERAEWKNGIPPGWIDWSKAELVDGKLTPKVIDRNPPGWDKWDKEKKKEWKKSMNNAVRIVRMKVKMEKKLNPEELNSIVISVKSAIQCGVPVSTAENVVLTCFKKGMKPGDIEKVSRAFAYGAGKDIDFGKVEKYLNLKLSQSIDINTLAKEIYKKISQLDYENTYNKK